MSHEECLQIEKSEQEKIGNIYKTGNLLENKGKWIISKAEGMQSY